MNFAQKLNTIRTIRFMAVVIMGILGLYATAIICAMLLRRAVADASMYDLGLTVIFVLISGFLVTAPICLLVYHFFSLWGTTTLPKAIRLNEAMRLLYATTHHESIKALKHHDISVYRSKIPLGKDTTDDVPCKIISTFLSPLFFRSDRLNALGSEYYCCDYNEIQFIIIDAQHKWSTQVLDDGATATQLAILEKMNVELLKQKREANEKYTSANGTNAKLKGQLDDAEKHMTILIELAHKV